MAEQKQFHWIELKDDFFEMHGIKQILSHVNGCQYLVLFQKLCLLTANKDGKLSMRVGEMVIPYDVERIARDTRFSIDTVIVAISLFKRNGLMYEDSEGILTIPLVNEITRTETPVKKLNKRSVNYGKEKTNHGTHRSFKRPTI